MIHQLKKYKEKTIELESSIQDMDEVEYVFSQVGSPAEAAQYGWVGSSTEATFSILLNDKKDTDLIVKEMEKKKDQYPDAI